MDGALIRVGSTGHLARIIDRVPGPERIRVLSNADIQIFDTTIVE